MSADDLELRDVERLALRPGDSLVIRFPGQISQQQAARVIERVRATLGLDDSVPVLVLPAGAIAEVIGQPGEITR